jgi:tetratricopeptide (TPR) repeat protein
MWEQQPFYEVLGTFMQRAYCSGSRLAQLSGLPRQTIISWLQGRVNKPHRWQDVARVAAALHLNEADATLLLRSAGHCSIDKLRQAAGSEAEQAVLAPWPGRSAPFQAIAGLTHFVGREAELADLEQALLNGRAVAITSLEGMGGIGKTSLAAHLAHRVRHHFPDGVLWARLDTSDPLSILSTFAAAYGRDVSDYPDLDSRSRVVRELLAGKRVLVVLDNAERDEQVQPLLPAAGHCAVIITSRRRDLCSAHRAYRLALHSFDPQRQEALALFARVLGEEVVNRHRAELAAMADLLGHLPLAVDIAASRLAHEPGWTVPAFLARLRQEQQRLAELAYGDISLRLSCTISYRALPPGHRQFFAALGVFGPKESGAEAAAHVAELTLTEAEDCLRVLHRFCLVQLNKPGRWRLHPLLRNYAREQLRDDGAWLRLVDYFVAYAAGHSQDHSLLRLEFDNLIYSLEVAHDQAWQSQLVRGVLALAPYLELSGLYSLALTHLERAIEAAQKMADEMAQVALLRWLATMTRRLSDYERAATHFQDGLALAYKVEADQEICALLHGLGALAVVQGAYVQGERYLTEGLDLARAGGYLSIAMSLLEDLAGLAIIQGDSQMAVIYVQEGLDVAHHLGDAAVMCQLLNVQGLIAAYLSQYDRATSIFEQALPLARQVGDRRSISKSLINLGTLADRRGDQPGAEKYWLEAARVAEESGHQANLALLSINLGWSALERQDYEKAEVDFGKGLALARKIDNRIRISSALEGLGTVALRRHDYQQAEMHLVEGLALAEKIGHTFRLCRLLHARGELYLQKQEYENAAAAFCRALHLAHKAGMQEVTAMALFGQARLAAALNDAAAALQNGHESLALFNEIGHHRAGEVAEWLKGVESDSTGLNPV